ncbi:hypothetical protein BSFA1_59660 [Burkholderia sp. SFA1]|nr:hypothetical protein BSFA1_59660 [Burkholderia sp. SFA1]
MQSLQDAALLGLCTSGAPISIYLQTGIRLQGCIEAFDEYALLLYGNGVRQIVQKHAVASIMPATSE